MHPSLVTKMLSIQFAFNHFWHPCVCLPFWAVLHSSSIDAAVLLVASSISIQLQTDAFVCVSHKKRISFCLFLVSVSHAIDKQVIWVGYICTLYIYIYTEKAKRRWDEGATRHIFFVLINCSNSKICSHSALNVSGARVGIAACHEL